MRELLARVKANIRRSALAAPSQGNAPAPTGVLRKGDLVIDFARYTVSKRDVLVDVTSREYELLSFLMKNAGQAFTREQLLSSVWSEDFLGETRTVDVHVGTLRQKLGSCGKYIRTVRGVGYKLEV